MILRSIAKMLIQEHEHRPITGRVLALGPQLVPMSRTEVDSLFEGSATAALDPDDGTHVSDEYFFQKLAIDRLDSLDVVEGFGGSIIHDLNEPVPPALEEQFDFILDGGTFDHLVNPGIAFQSVIRMLKPGGRVFHYNAASGYLGAAYVTFGPDLFFDYYVVNGFADCKVYVARETAPLPNAPWDLFYIPNGRTKDLNSGRHQMVIAIAEKGPASVADRIPIEYSYRSKELRERFAAVQAELSKSPRPVLSGTKPVAARAGETMQAWRMELAHVRKRRRAGTFNLRTHRQQRKKPKYLSYTYVGRI